MSLRILCPVLALLCAQASWALEGTALLTSGDWFQGGDLVKVDCATGERTTLVTGGDIHGPCFSPDGSRIAYAKGPNYDAEGSGDVYVINADGGGKTKITTCGIDGMAMNWTTDDHLFWGYLRNLFRVQISTGEKRVVHVASGLLSKPGVSLDGKRVGCGMYTPSLALWAFEIGGNERKLGSGCQGSISPDGTLVTNNLSDHRRAYIRRFADGSVYKTITIASGKGEFNMHRYSHSDNDFVLYTADRNYAYVCRISTDTSYYVGRGAAWDYFPGTPVSAAQPVISLQPETLVFTATAGGSDPSAQTISAVNTGGGTLGDLIVEESAPWLQVTRGGSGNGQKLVNAVNIASLEPSTYSAAVTVSGGGTSDLATYNVTLTVTSTTENDPTPDPKPSSPSITLLSPRGGETWPAGSTHNIQWTASNLDDVTIRYSTDGGVSWRLIATSVNRTEPEWGNYPWSVPSESSSQCLIYITGYEGEAPTESARFAITSGGPDATAPTITVSALDIRGLVDDLTVILVVVGGTEVPATGSAFNGTAVLASDQTTLTLRASDEAGNVTVRSLRVVR